MKLKAIIWGIIAACFIAAMSLIMQYRAGYILPLWINWQKAEISSESGADVHLSRKQITVKNDNDLFWQSGNDIKVQNVLICDIDEDNEDELMLLCWRRGRYGGSRPFWETQEDENTWSQHIYIYDLSENEVTPIWMASYIGIDVKDWSFSREERLIITARDGTVTRWNWVSWGLERIE